MAQHQDLRSLGGTVALSDRPTQPAPLACPEAKREAFICPVYRGFAGCLRVLASLLGASRGRSSPQCNSARHPDPTPSSPRRRDQRIPTSRLAQPEKHLVNSYASSLARHTRIEGLAETFRDRQRFGRAIRDYSWRGPVLRVPGPLGIGWCRPGTRTPRRRPRSSSPVPG
jgi:hypothetical protein